MLNFNAPLDIVVLFEQPQHTVCLGVCVCILCMYVYILQGGSLLAMLSPFLAGRPLLLFIFPRSSSGGGEGGGGHALSAMRR